MFQEENPIYFLKTPFKINKLCLFTSASQADPLLCFNMKYIQKRTHCMHTAQTVFTV